MEITFLTFNYSTAGRYVNGPGMCLHNLVSFLKELGYTINVFSILPSPYEDVESSSSIRKIKEAIDRSFLVHHWSGLERSYASLCSYAKKQGKLVYVGPNLIDGVNVLEEQEYLKRSQFDLLLTVNKRLTYRIYQKHGVPIEKMEEFIVGPDVDLWAPSEEKEDFILWKGNSKQHVKDVKFAIKLAKKLKGKYRFKFIGHPRPYVYEDHIEEAKKAKLYICTSLSETMGLALAEQWTAGIPSVTHPKIYLHGENYRTGIITSKTIDDYATAIDEIMTNDALYEHLSKGAKDWARMTFRKGAVVNDYHRLEKKVRTNESKRNNSSS